jgi:hypothetical protein
MKYEKITGDGIVEGFTTRKDGTAKITISTQELTQEQAGVLFGFTCKFVKFYLTMENISEDDMSAIDGIVVSNTPKPTKSKSQRLRAVIYRVWESKNNNRPFDEYYDMVMERVIERLKNMLD